MAEDSDSQSFECSVTYSSRIVRRALIQFFLARLGKFTIAPFILVWVYFGALWFSGLLDRSLLIVAAVLGSVFGVLGWSFWIRLRQSETFLSRMGEPIVAFVFDEQGVLTRSELGQSMLGWKVFDEILEVKDFWLLVYGKSAYLTLPRAVLTRDLQEFIKSKMISK